MSKIISGILFSFLLLSCNTSNEKNISEENSDENPKNEIENTLNNWHKAAAAANFDAYFSFMAENSVYIGTDATEYWNLKEFKKFSEPYFKSGKAWDFTSLERNIYFSENQETVWFDELLETHMGICRGSGVMVNENGSWKIAHYVLSMTIPNDATKEVAYMKRHFDESYTKKLGSEKNN
ncbi:MAG TPA: nuclear transport factor 2 family protein [Flavobacteriaceae bacterium]|nr:nuclear transport factor 2 family protein [Flavobacteriaceae bacterium]